MIPFPHLEKVFAAMKQGENTDNLIPEEDARSMVRLLGEVALMDAPRQERRKSLMEGLARLIDADGWCWATAGNLEAGERPFFTFILIGGFSEEQFATLMEASEHPDMKDLHEHFLRAYAETGGHTTRLMQQINLNYAWEKSDVYYLWRKADYGPNILSLRPTDSGQASFIGIYRHFNRPLFSERESRIAHIVLSELPSLHDEMTSSDLDLKVGNLAPRHREVLNILLHGSNRREIAKNLGISVHTVGDYVKDIYRAFSVHSQAELIRRFLIGDGGDIPHGNSGGSTKARND